MEAVESTKQDQYALAVHAVGHASVAGDTVAEVLDVEGAFETRGEEAAEGSYEGREAGHEEQMDLVWSVRDRRDVATELHAQGKRDGSETRLDIEYRSSGEFRSVRTRVDRDVATGCQICQSRHTKTGFGVHCMSLQIFTPRSCTGQIM